MAYIFFIDSVGTGVRAPLTGDYNGAFVRAGVTVGSQDNYAIYGTGSGLSAIVAGNVIGTAAISLGGNSLSMNQSVVVKDGAEVVGYNGTGISVAGYHSTIKNAGSIFGSLYGVLSTADGSQRSTITNTGDILGNGAGVYRAGGETLVLKNFGTIEGGDWSFSSSNIGGVDKVVNKGEMIGDIALGGGSDLYDGRFGHVDGTVFGGADLDTLYGGTDDDILDGGTGADTMKGGLGDDSIYVDDVGDRITEVAGQGYDTAYASGDYTLHGGASIEVLTVADPTSTTSTYLVGNEIAQEIVGGAALDRIGGRGGNDSLTGGMNNDVFYFATTPNASTNLDTITDFANVVGNNDLIAMENAIFTGLTATGTLAASLFNANAAGTATETDDRVIFETDTGKVFYDADGSNAGAAVQFATIANFASLTGAAALSAADFFVY
ncbi:hypothetical protein BH10PSE7_BH10PSE7_33250 [soil metagenome]